MFDVISITCMNEFNIALLKGMIPRVTASHYFFQKGLNRKSKHVQTRPQHISEVVMNC